METEKVVDGRNGFPVLRVTPIEQLTVRAEAVTARVGALLRQYIYDSEIATKQCCQDVL